jgi:hypothetical protein
MTKRSFLSVWIVLLVAVSTLLSGGFSSFAPAAGTGQVRSAPDWRMRVVSDEELVRLAEKDRGLDLDTSRNILARLNGKEAFYIRSDIRNGAALKVPEDFRSFLHWTPLPQRLSRFASVPKVILIVKEVPFLGWYEGGQLAGDSQACIGREGQDTRSGLYRVLEKDRRHESKSYSNEYGTPAWMPWSLRVYETVYIHAGNVFGDHCSHGCIILPMETAETLFDWADANTPILILESLDELEKKHFGGEQIGNADRISK